MRRREAWVAVGCLLPLLLLRLDSAQGVGDGGRSVVAELDDEEAQVLESERSTRRSPEAVATRQPVDQHIDRVLEAERSVSGIRASHRTELPTAAAASVYVATRPPSAADSISAAYGAANVTGSLEQPKEITSRKNEKEIPLDDVYALCRKAARGEADAAACPFNVLAKVRASDVELSPFAHLVRDKGLPWWMFHKLERAYPSDRFIRRNSGLHDSRTTRSNVRVDVSAHRAEKAANPKMRTLWLEFMRFHTSPAFFKEVVRVFGDAIAAQHPTAIPPNQTLASLSVKPRYMEDADTQFNLDCQVGINTPVTASESVVRGLHVDVAQKVIAGLFYFRNKADSSRGGSLQLWSCPAPCTWEMYRDVTLYKEVPYRRNVLVFFVNSEISVHAVTPRSVTPWSRRLVNFIGQSVTINPKRGAPRAAAPATQ